MQNQYLMVGDGDVCMCLRAGRRDIVMPFLDY